MLASVADDLIRLEVVEGGPEVRLLDARLADLGDDVLRRWARSQREAGPGTFVTRSYRYPYALVAWHDAAVGIDIERTQPSGPGFADSISTPAERLARPEDVDPDRYATSLWSSKEALAKALGNPLGYDPRRLDSPLGWSDGRRGTWRAAELPAPAGHVAWICWRQALPER